MRTCPVCASRTYRLLMMMPTGQLILSCVSCSMVYASTSAPDYATSSMYIDPALYGGPDHQVRHQRLLQRLCSLTSGSVVDIGCATGELLDTFARVGWPVKGVSVSQAEVDCCLARGLTAELRGISSPDREYDLAILSHVLEHIDDVRGFLHDLGRWVRPGGFLYVEVPDATRYPDYIHSISQGFNLEHINHFSIWHLVHAVSEAGFLLKEHGTERGENPDCRMIWGIFERVEPSVLADQVRLYADRLQVELSEIRHILDFSLHYALWGVGQAAEILVGLGVKVIAATDSNQSYWGREKFGVTVSVPYNFHPPVDQPILVCSQISKNAIIDQIRKLGLKNDVITLEGAGSELQGKSYESS